MLAKAVEAYRRADRLDPFGFSGWIGREPHGADPADCGSIRDGVFADQVVELFDHLVADRADGPWLAVASFVNPHDIGSYGMMWDQLWALGEPDDSVPEIDEAPSQGDSFAGRPACQEQWKDIWPQILYDQPTDNRYWRSYYHLHRLVDQAIGRVLESLEASGMADDTIVVLTSDHGEMLGAHGGMQQKWYNAFEETVHVPLLVRGPGVMPASGGVSIPTSHVDLVPTLMGLAGIDVERAAVGVAEHHDEAHPLPGRDLSGAITGEVAASALAAPVYFMTEDDVSRGQGMLGKVTQKPYDAVQLPSRVEMMVTTLPTGPDGVAELWKLNHYFEQLDEWNESKGLPTGSAAGAAAEPVFEMHNLTVDPEERHNRVGDATAELSQLQSILASQRDEKRLLPRHRNPV